MNKYIDLKNFDIHEEEPAIDSFSVEPLMASPISILNKKGYITESCCEGHIPKHKDKIFKADSKIESECNPLFDGIRDLRLELVMKKDEIYYYSLGVVRALIRFDDSVVLPSIPEGYGFYKTNIKNKTSGILYSIVTCYRMVNGIAFLKPKEEIEFDIKNMNERLHTWAISLPDLSINKGKSPKS